MQTWWATWISNERKSICNANRQFQLKNSILTWLRGLGEYKRKKKYSLLKIDPISLVVLCYNGFNCLGKTVIHCSRNFDIFAFKNYTYLNALFPHPPTPSLLAFTASLPEQKHSRAKSRQLRRLELTQQYSQVGTRNPAQKSIKFHTLNLLRFFYI